MSIFIDGVERTALFSTLDRSEEDQYWMDDDFISLAPTEVSGTFDIPVESTTSDKPITIIDAKIVMSYTLEMFNGEYTLVMNGYLDFYARIGTEDIMTESEGDTIWMSELTRKTCSFTSTKNVVVQLPNTPTPTPLGNSIFV